MRLRALYFGKPHKDEDAIYPKCTYATAVSSDLIVSIVGGSNKYTEVEKKQNYIQIQAFVDHTKECEPCILKFWR